MPPLTYKKAIRFLESLPGLEPGRPPGRGVGSGHDLRGPALLQALGHPEKGHRYIHVGGTSGKGSTVLALHTAYAAVGAPVFSFTSPHLITTLERFSFRAGLCPIPIFLRAVEDIKAACLTLHEQKDIGAPGYFDALFAIALVAARYLKADPVILEVGLGGRLDGTNIIENPIAAMVTNVGLDHMHILGNTVEEIARDKGGIYKKGCALLTGSGSPAVQKILKEEAAKVATPLLIRNQNYGLESKNGVQMFHFRNSSMAVGNLKDMSPYQKQNFENSLALLCAGQEKGLPFNLQKMRPALEARAIPGRFEPVELSPPIILDVAHNPDKLSAFAQAFSQKFGSKGTVVFGLARDKDLTGSIEALKGHFQTLIATRTLLTHRPVWRPREIKEAAASAFEQIWVTIDPWSALAKARQTGEAMAITGSTYLVGDLRCEWRDEAKILEEGVNRTLRHDS